MLRRQGTERGRQPATSGAGRRQPASTNAYIAMKSAPDHKATAVPVWTTTRLHQDRAVADIENFTVWNDHSPTMYADYRFATIKGESVAKMINDQDWNTNTFLPTVGKRSAVSSKTRGLSSASAPTPPTTCATGRSAWQMGHHGHPIEAANATFEDIMFGFVT
jgi:malate dehydrogenase